MSTLRRTRETWILHISSQRINEDCDIVARKYEILNGALTKEIKIILPSLHSIISLTFSTQLENYTVKMCLVLKNIEF